MSKIAVLVANSVDPDETFAASHLGLHCLLNITYARVIDKIKIKSSAITNRLSITMAGLIIDYLFSSD